MELGFQISPTARGISPPSQPKTTAPAPRMPCERATVLTTSHRKLSMEEHNQAQMDLMLKMAGEDNEALIGWIGAHGAHFRQLVEDEESGGLRQQLRDPEQRNQALDGLQRRLLAAAQLR